MPYKKIGVEMKNRIKAAILSLSLITVMAGAATAPALGAIATHFNDVHPLLIKLIITLPSLFIIFTTLAFHQVARVLSIKKIAVLGLVIYIIGGCGAGVVNDIYYLLFFRAILGVGVGLIMPLSTGLISYFFDKDERTKLMGYSSAMNNLGGVIAMSLSGVLVTFNWRYSFAVYLLGLLVLILIVLFLPDTDLKGSNNRVSFQLIKQIYPYLIGIFSTMLIFYTLPSNFSLVVMEEGLFRPSLIGAVMAIQTLGAFQIGMKFSAVKKRLGDKTKYVSCGLLFVGYLLLSVGNGMILIMAGLLSIGFGLGLIVPLLNSQIAATVDKKEVTSAMAITSSMLYLGQFISPLLVQGIQSVMKVTDIRFPYYMAMGLTLLLGVWMKRCRIN